MTRTVCVVLTTRGNYAKMKSTMRAIVEQPRLELQLVLGGGILSGSQGHYRALIEGDGFRIDRCVDFLVEGDDLVAMTTAAGRATIEVGRALADLGPDVVLVIADRFEALSVAVAALCMTVPIAHLEGGEVSGSIDDSIRHALTKLAQIHFVANREAAERIRRLGEPESSIVVTGSPSLDLLADLNVTDLSALDRAQRIEGGGELIDFTRDYIVVLQHPVVTEYGETPRQFQETAMAVEELGLPAVWVWPNFDAGSGELRRGIQRFCAEHPTIKHVRGLPMETYAVLLKNSRCLIGNSSSGIRECEFLGVPVVNIGTRQDGRQRGANVLDVPHDRRAILEAIGKQFAHGPYESGQLYGDGHAGQRIARVLAAHEVQPQKRLAY